MNTIAILIYGIGMMAAGASVAWLIDARRIRRETAVLVERTTRLAHNATIRAINHDRAQRAHATKIIADLNRHPQP